MSRVIGRYLPFLPTGKLRVVVAADSITWDKPPSTKLILSEPGIWIFAAGTTVKEFAFVFKIPSDILNKLVIVTGADKVTPLLFLMVKPNTEAGKPFPVTWEDVPL